MPSRPTFPLTASVAALCMIVACASSGKKAVDSSSTDRTVPAPSGMINWWPANGNGRDIVHGDDVRLVSGAYAPGLVGQAFDLSAKNHSYAVTTRRDGRWAFGIKQFTIELWVNFRTWHPTGI